MFIILSIILSLFRYVSNRRYEARLLSSSQSRNGQDHILWNTEILSAARILGTGQDHFQASLNQDARHPAIPVRQVTTGIKDILISGHISWLQNYFQKTSSTSGNFRWLQEYTSPFTSVYYNRIICHYFFILWTFFLLSTPQWTSSKLKFYCFVILKSMNLFLNIYA